MERVDLAIVIPTLREERYIGGLLDTLARQSVNPQEIVIVDACSDDRTIEEIQKRQDVLPQLKVCRIPEYTIARQRNFGVAQTVSPGVLFLDADMRLDADDCLEKYVAEVAKRQSDIAIAETRPLSNNLLDRLYYKSSYWYCLKAISVFSPMALGMNLYVKKEPFLKVGGFNEEVWVGEDHELAKRMVKAGNRLVFLDEPKLSTSIRRITKEGRIGVLWTRLKIGSYIIRNGFTNIPKSVGYEFGNYGALER